MRQHAIALPDGQQLAPALLSATSRGSGGTAVRDGPCPRQSGPSTFFYGLPAKHSAGIAITRRQRVWHVNMPRQQVTSGHALPDGVQPATFRR